MAEKNSEKIKPSHNGRVIFKMIAMEIKLGYTYYAAWLSCNHKILNAYWFLPCVVY